MDAKEQGLSKILDMLQGMGGEKYKKMLDQPEQAPTLVIRIASGDEMADKLKGVEDSPEEEAVESSDEQEKEDWLDKLLKGGK